ncbi:hypothetical protein [Rhizobium sp. Root483D2]|uniref:hypothetical protein n=1 Tax=Rhizobium sp. Root483D2 TaxID=1736545 RepID=UPI000B09BAD8|nr:hypothetical protein [Rhizobium sp. Root483D2]
MPDYVIRVYDEKDDSEPARTYRVTAASVEEAVTEAANNSASWEKVVSAEPVTKP